MRKLLEEVRGILDDFERDLTEEARWKSFSKRPDGMYDVEMQDGTVEKGVKFVRAFNRSVAVTKDGTPLGIPKGIPKSYKFGSGQGASPVIKGRIAKALRKGAPSLSKLSVGELEKHVKELDARVKEADGIIAQRQNQLSAVLRDTEKLKAASKLAKDVLRKKGG